MPFKGVIKSIAGLAPGYVPGIQALKNLERERIGYSAAKPIGSVNVDQCLRPMFPNAKRWDYVIGVQRERRQDAAVWVEFHPASSSHVNDVLEKHDWLLNWLKSSAPALRKISTEYVWIATGRVSLTPDSAARKRLASRGLKFVTRLDLDRIA